MQTTLRVGYATVVQGHADWLPIMQVMASSVELDEEPIEPHCQPFETLQLHNARGCESVVDLIHDVPTCQVLIDRIMLQAELLIRQRLVHSPN